MNEEDARMFVLGSVSSFGNGDVDIAFREMEHCH